MWCRRLSNIAIQDEHINCFPQGSGGAAPLVNAVTEFNDAFNDVIDSNFSLVAEKENVGTFFKLFSSMCCYSVISIIFKSACNIMM